MSEAQVADNKKPADATSAAEKPAAAAATDTASASTKLLDACDNKPAETKAEASSTAADTTPKESAPTVKEDHVETLLRGDQNKDGDDEDDKTSNCQKEYLDSVKQGAKPAEAQNTANLPELAIKEEQVKDLPKDSKQVGGDEKSGYKVFEGPDGKRYFQKGNGQFTVLEVSADGKRYEGTMDQGHKKVVMDKSNNDSEAVKVLDDKGKQVEKFEHKNDGGNIFSRKWNSLTETLSGAASAVNDNVIQPVAKAANDYVVQPVKDTAVAAAKAVGLDSIFSDEKWDFSTDSKDLPAPPPPPDDYSWLDASLNDSDAFWNEDDFSLLEPFDEKVWSLDEPAKGEPRTVFHSATDTVTRTGGQGRDGTYTIKHGNEEIELKKAAGEGDRSNCGGEFEGTLANGDKVSYDRAKGTLTIGDKAIERTGNSSQVRDVPEGSTKIAGDETAGKEVWQGPDGKRYIRDGKRDFTVMEVSKDGNRWEGTLKNGSKVVMDKTDPENKFQVFDHEGRLVDRITQKGDIYHQMGDKTTAVIKGPPPNSEQIAKLDDGVYSYVDGNPPKVTRIIKGDGLVAVADPSGQVELRLNGKRFGRESQEKGGDWADLDNPGKTIPEDVQAKLNTFINRHNENVQVDNMVVRPLGANKTAEVVLFNTPEEAKVCAETNVCKPGETPGLVGIVSDKPGGVVQMQDFQRDQNYVVSDKEINVTSISTGEDIWNVDLDNMDFSFDGNTLNDDGFFDEQGFGMDAEGNVYDTEGNCIYDDGWAGSSSESAREEEYQRSEAVGDAEMGKASSLISPARGVIYGAFDPATAESLCSAAYAGLSGAINLAMSCGNTAMAGELMSKQAEASSWIYISSGARKATTQHAHELPGGGGGMSFMMAEAARSTASGVSPTTAFENMLAKADPTNPKVAHRTGNPISLTWTDGRGDNNRAA